MFKKLIVIMASVLALTACGKPSPTIYNERYMIEEQNEYVNKVTDLMTDEVKWETKDGAETPWFAPDTTWEEARESWK